MKPRPTDKPETQSGFKNLSIYYKSSRAKAIWQIINSVVPYICCWTLMVYLVNQRFPYWLVLLLSVIAAGFLMRIFILFHDCCHSSFFASRAANLIVGYVFGLLIFTPYEKWRYLHLKHHGTTGNLDKRGSGDIWTLTVEEYLTASRWERILYRVVRNPAVMLIFGPILYFIVSQRFWHKNATARHKFNVLLTNIVLLSIVCISYYTISLSTFLLIQTPIVILAGAIGIWLFYVQHQFKGVYWARQDVWNPTRAAMEGSSFYKLPKLLQWITGNIGFHHIHHIKPQIPNYNLEKCYHKVTDFQSVPIVTLRHSLSSLSLKLWYEQKSRMISFRNLKILKLRGINLLWKEDSLVG